MNRVLELETILIGLRMLYGINGDAIKLVECQFGWSS